MIMIPPSSKPAAPMTRISAHHCAHAISARLRLEVCAQTASGMMQVSTASAPTNLAM